MAEQDVVQEITSLVEERRRFEQWLSALDARRASTPGHVFDRVRADYQQRLARVVTRLGEFVPRLRELEQGLTSRLDEVQAATRAAEDHRAESELRAHVGELSGDEWELVQRETGKKLEHLGEERATIDRELAGIRELMSGTSQETAAVPEMPAPSQDDEAAASSGPSATTVATPEPAPDSATESAPTSAPESAPKPRISTQHSREELEQALPWINTEPTPAWAKVVADREAEAARDAEPAPSAAPAPPRTSGPQDPDRIAADTLPQLEAVRGDHPDSLRGPTPAESLTAPADAPVGRLSGATERPVDDSLGILVQGSSTDDLIPVRRTSKETPLAAHVPANNPMVLRGEPAGKTLKCSECGAMNLPTEWYCEKCGAELAAL